MKSAREKSTISLSPVRLERGKTPATMKAVLQRVLEAQVTSEDVELARQGRGFLILLGISKQDGQDDIAWLVRKIAGLRIFPDREGKMNLSLSEAQGSVTVVSQFTLLASTKKGNRPSFLAAAPPEIAEPLYLSFCDALARELSCEVGQGRFGADMQISLVNDGPVTILYDSQNPD